MSPAERADKTRRNYFSIRRTKSELGYVFWVLHGHGEFQCFVLFDSWREAIEEAIRRALAFNAQFTFGFAHPRHRLNTAKRWSGRSSPSHSIGTFRLITVLPYSEVRNRRTKPFDPPSPEVLSKQTRRDRVMRAHARWCGVPCFVLCSAANGCWRMHKGVERLQRSGDDYSARATTAAATDRFQMPRESQPQLATNRRTRTQGNPGSVRRKKRVP